MRLRAAVLLLCLGVLTPVRTQVLFQESFDTAPGLPAGWSVWNRQPFPILPLSNWTVRDTGVVPPGIVGNRTRAHSFPRAAGVSWWASIDTTGAPSSVADAWLVTRRIFGIRAGDALKFWASGGSPLFLDSLQVWVSAIDSTTTGMISGQYLGSVIWPGGSVFGQFTQHVFPLGSLAGYDVWIGFRYYMNCSVNGFYVHVDDVSVEPATSVASSGGEIPAAFGLEQNYPNPFNGQTRIGIRVPATAAEQRVVVQVVDLLGREVGRPLDERLAPGSYTVSFDASGLPSGVYLCRLSAGARSATTRMVLLK